MTDFRNGFLARAASIATALALPCALAAAPARAFSVFGSQNGAAPDVMARAPRWSAEPDPFGLGTGLHDGIQVAVDESFATNLGSARIAEQFEVEESVVVALVEETVVAAFEVWENEALWFDIEFAGETVHGTRSGAEVDLFAEPFPDSTFFGFAQFHSQSADDRLLTNGQRMSGDVIVGADVFINTIRMEEGLQLLSTLGFPLDTIANALRMLISHEIGHALGLAHPNQSVFYDTDDDPYNPMSIDPDDPFRDIIVSAAPIDPPGALMPIMWGGLSSTDPAYLLGLVERLLDPSLAYDDIGGRDVLYPTRATCLGDCDGDGEVTVDELVRAVNLALGVLPIDDCTSLDRNGDGGVTVDEVVAAVSNALEGCE